MDNKYINKFDNYIWNINVDTIRMMTEVENRLERVLASFKSRNSEELKKLISLDDEINKERDEIEKKALTVIVKRQPLARDLRKVLAIYKIVTDLERIGDHVKDIAEIVIDMKDREYINESDKIIKMFESVIEMFNLTIDSYANTSEEGSKVVFSLDDNIDNMYNNIKSDIINNISLNNKDVFIEVSLLNITKYLEKIGDHSVNIAKYTLTFI